MNAVSKIMKMPGRHETMRMVRTFHASRAAVWEAWTDPAKLRAWWGPHGFTNGAVSLDLRVGGAQRIEMLGPDGGAYPLVSEFREIVPGERLKLLNRALPDAAGQPQLEVMTTVEFAEERGKTTVTVVEDVLRATPAASGALAGMEEGMDQSLERLAGHLGSLVLGVAEAEPFLWMSRIFDAPRDLVWRAITDPKHAVQWWGQREAKNVVFELDCRPGGKWRVHQQYADGRIFKFKGEVREVEAPVRVVQTFGMEEMFEDKVIVETLTLTDLGNGRTLYKVVSHFESFEDRAGMMASGMSHGAQEMLQRLAEHLLTM